MKKNILIAILSILHYVPSFAQIGKNREEWETKLKTANELLQVSSYYTAIPLLEDVIKKQPTNVVVQNTLADAYMKVRNYKAAEPLFRQLYEDKTPAVQLSYPNIGFYYAQVLKNNEKYTQARDILLDFMNTKGSATDPQTVRLLTLAQAELMGCELGAGSGEKGELITMGEKVNSAYTDYAPMPTPSGMFVFSSFAENEYIEAYANYSKSKIYAIDKTENGWGKKTELPATINKNGFHNGNATFTEDGHFMFFTRCIPLKNNQPSCGIYMAEVVGNEYLTPEKLNEEINYPNAQTTHPFVVTMPNGEIKLFYSLNRPGGKGGMDIWSVTRKANAKWGKPTNLSGVNTEGDEITPFVNLVDNLLYFSSNGQASMGGYDIFKTELEGGSPIVSNLGRPINSSADDMYFVQDPAAEMVYVVSNRSGGKHIENPTCCDDLYSIKFNDAPRKEIFVSVKEETTTGAYTYSDCAKIYLYDVTNLPEKVLLSEIKCTGASDYKFTLLANKKYEIEAEKNGFRTQQVAFSTNGLRKKETEQTEVKLPRVRANSPTVVAPSTPKSYNMSGCIYIEDNNQRTAVEDAELVVYEIDSKSEVEIERVSIDNCYNLDLPLGSNYRILAYKKGFITGHIDLSTRNGSKGYKDIYLKPKRKNAVFKIDNVYYDLAVATLRPESETALNGLVKMLKDNPSLIIEIDAHTDSRGSAEANRILSQNRAQSVVNYLVENGISAKRLQAKGLGETQPVNKCKDNIPCTEEEYQLNRRTEFKILGETNE